MEQIDIRDIVASHDSPLVDRYFTALTAQLDRFGATIEITPDLAAMETLDREDAKLFPVLEHASGNRGFWVILRDREGVAATGGAALLSHDGTLKSVIENGLYSHRPGDQFEVSDIAEGMASDILGRSFVFSGNVYVAKRLRRHADGRPTAFRDFVITGMPSLCRAISFGLWESDHVLTFIRRDMAARLIPNIIFSFAVPAVRMYRNGEMQRGGHMLCYTSARQAFAGFTFLTEQYDRDSAQVA